MSEELKDKEVTLLPCPFCGSESGNWNEHEDGCWFRMEQACDEDGRDIFAGEELVNAWNSRPSTDEALVSALRNLLDLQKQGDK